MFETCGIVGHQTIEEEVNIQISIPPFADRQKRNLTSFSSYMQKTCDVKE